MRRLPHLTISPLFFLLCLLCVPLRTSALGAPPILTCEGEGAPFFVPLTAKFELNCNYQQGAYPILAYRLDGPPGYTIAMYKVRTNETTTIPPGDITLGPVTNESITITFHSFKEALYRDNYQLMMIDEQFQQAVKTISIQRLVYRP